MGEKPSQTIKVPTHIAAIPLIKAVLSDYYIMPEVPECKTLTHDSDTKNKDGSVSHNYTAEMYLHGDAGSRTTKEKISLVKSADGKYTLFVGDTTSDVSYNPTTESHTNNPVKKTGKLDKVDEINGLTEKELNSKVESYQKAKDLKSLEQHLNTHEPKIAPALVERIHFIQEMQQQNNPGK